jgi:hypothetical protein
MRKTFSYLKLQLTVLGNLHPNTSLVLARRMQNSAVAFIPSQQVLSSTALNKDMDRRPVVYRPYGNDMWINFPFPITPR